MSILTALIAPVTDLISEFIPDTDKRDEIAFKLSTLAENHAHQEVLAQLEVNKAEAAHKSLFVAGWRPFIGWTCGVAMAFNYVGIPVIGVLGIEGVPMDLATMMPVLFGMLGFGGMRSFEKTKKVAREK